jgi:hypothetical protein
MSDPLRNKILDGLAKLTDREKFEACAADLLGKRYPTLVPISGGSDAGFDGAAVQPNGRILQLVCTTAEDVLANLSGSLEQAKKKGQKSDGVLIATTQQLTPGQKRKLGERAAEFGKTLYPVYDRLPIANLLYHDSAWRKSLLNIPGHPPALSLLPETNRPAFDLVPLGRDDELAALRSTTGDLVVVGQPGSGKTHLLGHLAANTNGLFVVTPDQEAIAEGIRDQKPDWVIVDDAFPRVAELAALRQARKGMDAGFRIIATCWPGQEDQVSVALGLSGIKPLNLRPLPVRIIKQIVNALDITGPDDLMREILHQSAGKPGLAVTLCQICWQSGTNELFTGDALTRDVKLSLVALAGEDAVGLLAYFALAGDAGLTIEAAAEIAEISPVVVARITGKLGAAGVLEVGKKQHLTVEPARLRQALVRDVFARPPALDWRRLLPAMTDRAESVATLLAAAMLKGQIDDHALREEIARLAGDGKHGDLCENYAWLGADQCRWVLDRYPIHVRTAAQPLLAHIAKDAIPVLLREDLALKYRPSQDRDELAELRRWVDRRANTVRSIPCRVQLLESVELLSGELRNTPTLFAALRIILSNHFEWTDQPPGDAAAFRIQHGFVPLAALDQIAALWPRILPMIGDLPLELALKLPKLISDWASPRPWSGGSISPELVAANERYARGFLVDLARLYADRWVVIRRFNWLADHLKAELPDIAGLPSLLFPPRDFGRDEALWRSQHEAVAKHAAEWSASGPTPQILDDWLRVDREATDASENYPNLSIVLAEEIAKCSSEPERWLDALLNRNAPPSLVAPFSDACGARSPEARLAFVCRFLGDPERGRLALGYLVRFIPVGTPPWPDARPALEADTAGLSNWIIRDEVPEDTLLVLLSDYGPKVAATAAANLWSAKPKAAIPAKLESAWRHAVVHHLEDGHELEDIGRQHPEIALAWAKLRLNPPAEEHYSEHRFRVRDHLHTLVTRLPPEQRRDLIGLIAAQTMDGELVARLVGDDLDLMRYALSRPETHDQCRSCIGLPGNPPTFWRERALLLLDASFDESEVMWSSELVEGGWSGPESDYLKTKIEAFTPLITDADPRIVQIGRDAVSYLTARQEQAREQERVAAVKGQLA